MLMDPLPCRQEASTTMAIHCNTGVAFPYFILTSHTKALAWVKQRKTRDKTCREFYASFCLFSFFDYTQLTLFNPSVIF